MNRKRLLGSLRSVHFLREYWQKKPLLIRAAAPGFRGLLSPDQVFHLACRDEVESRLILRQGTTWRLEHGPFEPKRFSKPPRGKWTVLVQSLNLHLPAAEKLLMQFDFVPYSRLDDLMVSYATSGGGVGPHFDSYDVFLLQGMGRRRWQISARSDRELLPDAPLRILSRFEPEQEWVLEPGDMLYLPPHYAHNGIAMDECMTYSVGFRAPNSLELGSRFLDFLQDRLPGEGYLYSDPDLSPTRHPAAIPERMVERLSDMIAQLHWGPTDLRRFIGQYLSEPKAHIVFSAPARPLALDRFLARCGERGLRLAPATLMLYLGRDLFLNGEHHRIGKEARALLVQLADRRTLPAKYDLKPAAVWLHEAYLAGYILVGSL
jgi:50S ribosomal protein L16 3-hydroxylase